MLLPLVASARSGGSGIFETLSVVTLSGLTVITPPYTLMLSVQWIALYAGGRHRELITIDPCTFATILVPCATALGSLLLYVTAFKGNFVSRVFPLTELGPVVAFALATLFLGEPWSIQRAAGTMVIIAGIVLGR